MSQAPHGTRRRVLHRGACASWRVSTVQLLSAEQSFGEPAQALGRQTAPHTFEARQRVFDVTVRGVHAGAGGPAPPSPFFPRPPPRGGPRPPFLPHPPPRPGPPPPPPF